MISDKSGKLKYSKTVGNLGFRDIDKRSIVASSAVLRKGFKYLLREKKKIFFKIEGGSEHTCWIIWKEFCGVSNDFDILGFKFINKISHSGCRDNRIIRL